ncbi:MAG: hypothetical protein ACRDY7_09525 [Acidimicrobiia bacterium]
MAVALERLIEAGALWEPDELARMAELAQGGTTGDLAQLFSALGVRMAMAPVPDSVRREVEGVVYPRLWKLLESVRDGLPSGEQQTRISVLNRRLARLFADEDPHPAT